MKTLTKLLNKLPRTETITYKKNGDILIYKIIRNERKKFYCTINDKRLTKINYARKYDAIGLLDRCIEKFGIEKLKEMSK